VVKIIIRSEFRRNGPAPALSRRARAPLWAIGLVGSGPARGLCWFGGTVVGQVLLAEWRSIQDWSCAEGPSCGRKPNVFHL
jgi:hypothetical protein